MLMDFGIAIIVGALLILLGIVLVKLFGALRQWAVQKRQPGVNLVLDALQPFVWQAILAGERAVLWGFQEVDAKLTGMDKKQVADAIYNLLPDSVLVGGRLMPIGLVKTLITREAFEELVKQVYDQADAFIERNKSYLHDQVELLKAAQHAPNMSQVGRGQTTALMQGMSWTPTLMQPVTAEPLAFRPPTEGEGAA